MAFKAAYVSPGVAIDYTPSTDVNAGDVVVVGNLIGIANVDIAAGQKGALAVQGIFDVVKDAAIAFAQGDLVYWDDTNKVATNTDNGGANPKMGVAVEAAGTSDATVRVRLSQ